MNSKEAEAEVTGPIGVEGATGAAGPGIAGRARRAMAKRLGLEVKEDGPRADIADTARLMPAFMEAEFARKEKIHPLVVVNNQGVAGRIKKDEVPQGRVIQTQGIFVLLRDTDRPRRAAWFRTDEPKPPEVAARNMENETVAKK